MFFTAVDLFIAGIYNYLFPFPISYSLCPHQVFLQSVVACLVGGPEGSGPLVILPRLVSYSFPLTLITGRGATKKCAQESPKSHT